MQLLLWELTRRSPEYRAAWDIYSRTGKTSPEVLRRFGFRSSQPWLADPRYSQPPRVLLRDRWPSWKGRRKRRDKWATYLAILDARDAGLSFCEIGEKFYEEMRPRSINPRSPKYDRQLDKLNAAARAKQTHDAALRLMHRVISNMDFATSPIKLVDEQQ